MQQVAVFVAGINKFPNMAERSCERLAIQLTGIQYPESRKKTNVDFIYVREVRFLDS